MDLVTLFEVLKKYDVEYHSIINGDSSFNLKLLQKFLSELKDAANRLDGFTIKSFLSRRRALVVILQERYYKLKSYDKEQIVFNDIEEEAKRRFKIKNRAKSKFNTPQVTHPKNPLNYYGNDKNSLNEYRETIGLLASMPDFYIVGDEAQDDIKKLYHRIEE
ncbi:hypothetical protein [Flavobacterium haoranii]|uniref:Uncharacterized protein n=1 Tax=Flavobacterium haoranii TaxID=683124 RepID=A0A1M6J6V2_9FLAO|nr:hypothetical protein [Flavobacterium haoranii]SHJ42412.1 hypothetical protein SAMN05444337_1986 [Flavobacterium haoranii]